jgi:hypothetical protein
MVCLQRVTEEVRNVLSTMQNDGRPGGVPTHISSNLLSIFFDFSNRQSLPQWFFVNKSELCFLCVCVCVCFRSDSPLASIDVVEKMGPDDSLSTMPSQPVHIPIAVLNSLIRCLICCDVLESPVLLACCMRRCCRECLQQCLTDG